MKKLNKAGRIVLLLIVAAGLLIAALVLVKDKKQELRSAPKFGLRPRPVTVTQAKTGTLRQKHHYLAVVEPGQTAGISARVTATVGQVLVDEGDRVEKGGILIKLDGQEIRHRLESVEAQIAQARADLAANNETIGALKSSIKFFKSEAKRYRRLAEKDAVPKSRAEQAEEKRAEVQGKLDSARKKSLSIRHQITSLKQQKKELISRLGYYTIKSPFAGLVSEVNVDPGDLASPGKIIVEVEDRDRLKLSFDVPQEDLPAVRKGLPVSFNLEQDRRRAEISLMYPSLNQARMMKAEVFLSGQDKKGLISGAYMPVSVLLSKLEGVTMVPRSSLIEAPDKDQYVFAVEEGRLEPRLVQVLGFDQDQAAIKGLKPGSEVVQNTYLGWARLSSGEKVKAIR